MPKSKTKSPSTTPQPAALSPRKRQNVTASRSTQSSTGTASNQVRRVAQGTTPQKVVKPTTTPSATTFSLETRFTRSQKKARRAHNHSADEATKPFEAANNQPTNVDNVQNASVQSDGEQAAPPASHSVDTSTSPISSSSFTVQLPLRTPQDVEMTDVSDLSDMDEDGLDTVLPAERRTSLEAGPSKTKCDSKRSVRAVHFAENDDVQPYSQAEKPTDVRSLASFIQKMSDKLSFLRDEKIYDTKIRLEIRGSALPSPVVLAVADATNMDAVWAKVVGVQQNIDQPYQIQFKLDEGSRPAGYDTSEDEKRFRFGKRAEDQLPEFVKRCQEAAHCLAKEAEEKVEEGGVNGGGEDGKIVGVIELMWRG